MLGNENDPSLPDNDVAIDLFDATLNLLDMDKADGWIIDSRASRSVTGDLTKFQSGYIEKALGTVSTASGQNLPVAAVGTMELANNGEIKLHEVLYVPGVTKNLLSVRSFCQHGYNLVFDDKQCLILKDRGVLDDSGLYQFIFEDCAFPL